MPNLRDCTFCPSQFPSSETLCPHCGRPALFPNVFAAAEATEREALERRYQASKSEAVSRGADGVLQDFEQAVSGSKVVITRSESEVLRLASSTRQLYSTYYQLIEGGVRLPEGDQWDILRELADTLLFPGNKKNIRFGALTLNGVGLSNYGSCSIVFRDDMISHRTSVFEENSAVFMERHNIKLSRIPNLPKGYRATWDDRVKLCVAKLSRQIDAATGSDKYSGIILKQEVTSEGDEFIEAHIWGPMSVLTMERVIITDPKPSKRAVITRTIASKLAAHNVLVN